MKVTILMINDYPQRVFKGNPARVHEYARLKNIEERETVKKASLSGEGYPRLAFYHAHTFDLELVTKDLDK